jgi:hypothetical protein
LLYHHLVDSLESGTDEAEGVRIRGVVSEFGSDECIIEVANTRALIVLDIHSVDNARGSHLTTSEADTRTGNAARRTK